MIFTTQLLLLLVQCTKKLCFYREVQMNASFFAPINKKSNNSYPVCFANKGVDKRSNEKRWRKKRFSATIKHNHRIHHPVTTLNKYII